MSADGKTKVGVGARFYQVFGFSFNNASTNIVFIMLMSYFIVFCTSYYGMNPAIVGLIMTITRLFDAVTDPLIGVLIDKTNTKFGRFRPWILGGALICAISFNIMFSGFKTGSLLGDYIFITAIYCIFILGYTMQTACTKSAQTVLTQIPKQRTTLNLFGLIWTMGIYMAILALVLPYVKSFGGTDVITGWRQVALAVGAIQLLFAGFVVFALRGADVPARYENLKAAHKAKLADYIAIFKHNKALKALVLAAATNKIAQTMLGSLTVLFYFYVAGNSAYQGIVPVVIMGLSIIAAIASLPLITKIGRVEAFKLSSILGFVFGLAMVPLIAFNPGNLIWLIAVLGLNGILIACTGDANLISMIADASDYEYYKYGNFIPGMVGTAFSFIDKIVSSGSTLIVGVVLAAVSFESIEITPQSSKMFWAVLLLYCVAPAIGHFFSIVGMKMHPLKKAEHQKMLRELAEQKSAQESKPESVAAAIDQL